MTKISFNRIDEFVKYAENNEVESCFITEHKINQYYRSEGIFVPLVTAIVGNNIAYCSGEFAMNIPSNWMLDSDAEYIVNKSTSKANFVKTLTKFGVPREHTIVLKKTKVSSLREVLDTNELTNPDDNTENSTTVVINTKKRDAYKLPVIGNELCQEVEIYVTECGGSLDYFMRLPWADKIAEMRADIDKALIESNLSVYNGKVHF